MQKLIRCSLNYCNCTNVEICCLIDYVLRCIGESIIHSYMVPYRESCGGYKVSYSTREVLEQTLYLTGFVGKTADIGFIIYPENGWWNGGVFDMELEI